MTSSKTEQPRTAAGRALQDEYPGVWWWLDEQYPKRWEGPLGAAIEAEAATGAKPDLLDALLAVWNDIAFYNSGTEQEPIESLDHADYLRLEAVMERLAASKEERP